MAEHEERRRYLDVPLILQLTNLEEAQDLIRPLCRTGLSPLPIRLRNVLARIHRQLGLMARELRRNPHQVLAEKAAEDAP